MTSFLCISARASPEVTSQELSTRAHWRYNGYLVPSLDLYGRVGTGRVLLHINIVKIQGHCAARKYPCCHPWVLLFKYRKKARNGQRSREMIMGLLCITCSGGEVEEVKMSWRRLVRHYKPLSCTNLPPSAFCSKRQRREAKRRRC